MTKLLKKCKIADTIDALMAYNTGSAWKSCLGLTNIIIRILKLLFSLLNIYGDIKDFQCKTCQFAKSRNTYPNSAQERNSITISLIHTDVWRYALVTFLSWYLVLY